MTLSPLGFRIATVFWSFYQILNFPAMKYWNIFTHTRKLVIQILRKFFFWSFLFKQLELRAWNMWSLLVNSSYEMSRELICFNIHSTHLQMECERCSRESKNWQQKELEKMKLKWNIKAFSVSHIQAT